MGHFPFFLSSSHVQSLLGDSDLGITKIEALLGQGQMTPNYLQKEGFKPYEGHRGDSIVSWPGSYRVEEESFQIQNSPNRVHFPKMSLASRSENGQVRPPDQTLMSTLQSSGNKSSRKEMRDMASKDKERNAAL